MLHIFFATGTGKPRTAARWCRLARRRRELVSRWATAWLVRTLSGSDLAHVCFGTTDGVLNPTVGGDHVWPVAQFMLDYPSLAWMVSVPTSRRVDIRALQDARPVSRVPSIIRWLLSRHGHFIRTRDCVQKTRAALAAGGVITPPLTTPAQLWDWLRSQGFEFTDLSGECTP